MLDRGDDAVLAAPIADFNRELERIHLLPANFHAVLTTNDYAIQTIEADVEDLRRALRKTELTKAECERIVLNYQNVRVQLAGSRQSKSWNSDDVAAEPGSEPKSSAPVPRIPSSVLVPDGLPGEFADYFHGCIEWHAGHTNEARSIWESLLGRPESERHYRSTWAAYMLGKYWQGVDEEKAIDYFQNVRTLAAAGFADRLGLAAASLGWEAHEELHQKHFDRAIQLYLQQLASGDGSATVSLRMAAGQALASEGDQLTSLATNIESRRVITAFITSRKNLESLFDDYAEGVTETNRSIVTQWLDAVEAANVTDVESAEQLALAAYQAGQWKWAQRWIERAKTTPVTEWLQAKLYLRSGKIEAAAALLERVARTFPLDSSATNRPEPKDLKDDLYFPGSTYVTAEIYPSAQVLAEMGTLRLARREYTEALDALLRSGFWMDAAYVAERVLTADELKNYVDQNWPAVDRVAHASTNLDQDSTSSSPMDLRREIRYLLGRRLLRTERGNEALEYYSAEQQADFAALLQNEKIANNGDISPIQQSAALFEMAKLVRHHGMELIGTEVEPDWHIHGGDYDYGVTIASRATNLSPAVLFASEEEVSRAQQQGVTPAARFHYRYQAAALAWKAATLMPNNTEETARVLCTAGTWLKNLDPQMADVFYKSLVRRCSRTDIGRLADRMRWFPELEENGNPVPWNPDPPREIEPSQADASANPNQRVDGYWYVLNRGNTLQDVVSAVNASHQLTLTVDEIQQANPAINPNRLKAGQKLFVAAPLPKNLEEQPLPTTTDGSGSAREQP